MTNKYHICTKCGKHYRIVSDGMEERTEFLDELPARVKIVKERDCYKCVEDKPIISSTIKLSTQTTLKSLSGELNGIFKEELSK